MNKVFLIGNLTKDPELNSTSSGISVCNFTLAVTRRFSANKDTDFLPVVVWRGQAENCKKYLKKGSRAAVAGSIQTRNYETQDGSKRYVTEIIADEVQFLNTRSESETPEPGTDSPFSDLKPAEENLPF